MDRGPDRVFKHLLREAGIDIERGRVEIVPPPANNSGISFGVAAGRALAEGKVDGLWSNVLGCELAIQQGGGSVIIDTRRGDGPPGAENYSFAALAVTDSNIETKQDRVEAVIRALVRAETVVRQDPVCATEVAKKLFPVIEAERLGQILARDAEFYRASISMARLME